MEDRLQAWAVERGCRVAWGPASVVEEAAAELAALSPELDPGLFEGELAGLARPEDPRAVRVLVVATPQPAHRVRFARAEGAVEALLPPTYFRYRQSVEDVRQELAHALPGARLEPLNGPVKAIAARLGLVAYGRNNLAYAPGMGSYLRLRAYWTDADLPDRSPVRPALLPQCEGCERCRKACPTGAIGPDRVLLRAHRCLTWANEGPGPWPAWAEDAPHHCLVGCLRCQRACPANPPLPVEDTGVTFSAEETQALLAWPDPPPAPLAERIRTKLDQLGPLYLEDRLGRNLQALVN